MSIFEVVMTPDVHDVALSYMEGLGSPCALSVAIMLRYGEFDQLSSKDVDPLQYNCSDAFFRDAAAVAFLKKADFLPLSVSERKARTLAKWHEAEQSCFRANRRLSFLLSGHPSSGCPAEAPIRNFFERVKRRIVNTIGSSCPPLSGRFGPGATLSDTSRKCSVLHKMSSKMTATFPAWVHLRSWSENGWARAWKTRQEEITEVRGNHYFQVPKTSRVDRPCCKEPSFNGFLQLGIGSVLRQRLKARAGIDLDHGQEKHRRLARDGSRSSRWSTLDLSSASDTICKTLVEVLLPPDWFELLSSVRSPLTLVNGKWYLLEKFSSMGNGYTFELETLIFWALCATVLEDCGFDPVEVSVYGDDIIIPSGSERAVVAALRYCGFELNSKKSFASGYFRESCGGDFFNGAPVRGHYLKELPDEPQKLISLANGIRRTALALCPSRLCDSGLLRSWLRVLDRIPSHIRSCRGPESLGDVVIHDEPEYWDTKPDPHHPWTFLIRVYAPTRYQRVRFERFDEEIQMAAAVYLLTTGVDDVGHYLVPRDGVLGYGRKYVKL
nr:MAG: RNA-dependent RNA polymerase [Hangzhou fiers-like virus 5]